MGRQRPKGFDDLGSRQPGEIVHVRVDEVGLAALQRVDDLRGEVGANLQKRRIGAELLAGLAHGDERRINGKQRGVDGFDRRSPGLTPHRRVAVGRRQPRVLVREAFGPSPAIS